MPSAHIWGVVVSAQPFEMQNVTQGQLPRVTEPRRIPEKPLVARVEVLVTPQEHVTVLIPEILRGEMLQEQRQAAR